MSILMLLIACGDETGVKEIPNSLPDAQIQSHSDGTSFQEGYEVQFYAQVSDQNHENEELQVAWFIDENLVCDWHTPDPLCGLCLVPDLLSCDIHHHCHRQVW